MLTGPSTRIAALDGWRGIAVLMVVGLHFQGLVLKRDPAMFHTGLHGVTAFFVLSGFLITGKLLEPDTTLKHFYVRRFFRLMPAAWAFLAFVWAFGHLPNDGHLVPTEISSCLLIYRNYVGEGPNHLSTLPFWSLSIEEQFYLFWPAILLFLRPKRAMWFAGLGTVASYVAFLVGHSYYDRRYYNLHTELHCSSLFMGCFLAIALTNETFRSRFLSIMKWAFWPLIAYLCWIGIQYGYVPSPLENAAWGCCIAYSCYHAPKFFTLAPLRWLGRVSYSVYIWNFFALWAFTFARPLGLIAYSYFLLPFASYYLIEKPGIALGSFILKRSVGHRFIPTQVLSQLSENQS